MGERFEGTIGRYHDESEPWWPAPVRAPAGAPNVVIVLLDDVGFAQLGCYGSDIETPVFDRLAERGVRYANFHTTALCSPTRAAVLTGRNHHTVGMGRITDLATGFPGYDGMIGREHGFLSEMLTPRGYAAWAVGKWHLTPRDEWNVAAPKDRWPLGRGFEGFYGFFSGETHQFAPALWHDNHQVDPPGGYEDGYHLTQDLVDRSIGYVRDLRQVDADKPFFLYLCPGACHSPHQVHQEWLDRYRGRFDDGWDVWREATLARQKQLGIVPEHTRLSPRPDTVPAWDDLDDRSRAVYARYMEAYAAMLSHTDHEVGRLVDFLASMGELDNTLFLALSDNGASSEGGPHGSLNDTRTWNVVENTVDEAYRRLDEIGGPRIHNNYPWGWTVAGNTPFRRWKRETHEGGVADPLIVSWPAGIAATGEVRHQYVHAIDLAPTILDVLGVEAPEVLGHVPQSPIEGVSFAHTFDDATAASGRTTQYYEMLGCRALYHDGWKAVVYRPVMVDEPHLAEDRWELYHVEQDPSETVDLAEEHPDKLQELIERWWVEAATHNVLPLDNRPFSSFVLDRPLAVPRRDHHVYRPDAAMVDEAVAIDLKTRPHQITAYVTIPEGGAEGVLIAQGAILGGWTFYLQDGVLTYAHNLVSWATYEVSAPVDLAPGDHVLRFEYERGPRAAGTGRLLVDGHQVAQAPIPRMTSLRYSLCGHGLTCGYDGLLAVVDAYEAPFRFTGTIDRVEVDVQGERVIDPFGEAAIAAIVQ